MRTQITDEQIDEAMAILKKMLIGRLEEKGYGTFASRHEVAGVIAEEVDELKDAYDAIKNEYDDMLKALRSNNVDDFRNELIDIAVACVFGVACIEAKALDW